MTSPTTAKTRCGHALKALARVTREEKRRKVLKDRDLYKRRHPQKSKERVL